MPCFQIILVVELIFVISSAELNARDVSFVNFEQWGVVLICVENIGSMLVHFFVQNETRL